jgi:hypothetical protein
MAYFYENPFILAVATLSGRDSGKQAGKAARDMPRRLFAARHPRAESRMHWKTWGFQAAPAF